MPIKDNEGRFSPFEFKLRTRWKTFLLNENNLGHVTRLAQEMEIEEHVELCMTSARNTARRVKTDLGNVVIRTILDVGASTGLNAIAIQELFPDATVIGIEPEGEAAMVAKAMSAHMSLKKKPYFLKGIGERMPLFNGKFDLILCHTVIEHVSDVPLVISEMARVLSPQGYIHLEAPNYIWPKEPHLQIWCLPILGKGFLRLTARLQGKGEMLGFLNHLQMIYPGKLEKVFRKNNLTWENRVLTKMEAVVSGDSEVIKAYRRLGRLLQFINRVGFFKLISRAVIYFRLHPSILYILRHKRKDSV